MNYINERFIQGKHVQVGKLSQKTIKHTINRLLKLWKEKYTYEENLVVGWEATFKLDPGNLYSFNVTDGFFQPHSSAYAQLISKVQQIVLPELRQTYKNLKSLEDAADEARE